MTKKFKLLDDDDEELANWECTRLPQSSFRTKRNSAIPSDRADATQRRDVHTVGEKRGRGASIYGRCVFKLSAKVHVDIAQQWSIRYLDLNKLPAICETNK